MEAILLTDFKIPEPPTSPGDDGNGVFSCIYRGRKLDYIAALFDRKNICLKIFRGDFCPLEDFWWGFETPKKGSKLIEATHIQNIFAHHRLAPRVYGIIIVEVGGKLHYAQVVEDAGHFIEKPFDDQPEFFRNKIEPITEKYQIEFMDDGREPNLINNLYVDFQGFHLPEDYRLLLKNRIYGIANIGKWGPWENYQSVLELKGGRITDHRIERLALDDINFKRKTVLDIGCSEGLFCHYAEKHGARRIVGIDLPGVVKPLWELASYLGYYNIDFHGYDLLKQTPEKLGKFDIVLFLSMGLHVGLPDWVMGMTDYLLVYEGNARDTDDLHVDKIAAEMDIVYSNYSEDLYKRRIVWGKKRPKK